MNFNASSPMTVVIVGGSISGLMHGIVLKHRGHNVRILEQSTQLERPDLAAGITTHPEFEKFMELHGTSEPWSIKSPGIQFLNKDSSIKRTVKKALQMTSWGVLYHHLRANFEDQKSLKKEGLAATFEGGKRVTGLSLLNSDGATQAEVTYDDLLKEKDQASSCKADLVIVANGHNSELRDSVLAPTKVQRNYAGYVAFRGTVPESEVSEESKKIFDPNLTYNSFKNGYILLYIIPGADGSLEAGHRRYNWVWYHPLAANSSSLTEIMTDVSGKVHRNTLPAGMMQLAAWKPYVTLATEVMCDPFAEMIQKTAQPFITAINDVSCPQAVAYDGKVLIVGEALNLMRPHMALSATQSAVQALEFERVIDQEITLEEWEKHVLQWGRSSALKTNAFGTFFLYGVATTAPWLLKIARNFITGFWPFSWLSGSGGSSESSKTK